MKPITYLLFLFIAGIFTHCNSAAQSVNRDEAIIQGMKEGLRKQAVKQGDSIRFGEIILKSVSEISEKGYQEMINGFMDKGIVNLEGNIYDQDRLVKKNPRLLAMFEQWKSGKLQTANISDADVKRLVTLTELHVTYKKMQSYRYKIFSQADTASGKYYKANMHVDYAVREGGYSQQVTVYLTKDFQLLNYSDSIPNIKFEFD